MKIFLAYTENPKNMLKNFKENLLDFLYHQEDKTEYKIKTISNLIDEIQDIPNNHSSEEIFDKLSISGKRRYTTILNQLKYMIKETV